MCHRVTFVFHSCVTFTISPICSHLWASRITQRLSYSPRHLGTGEFHRHRHNTTSERCQAAPVCRLTRLGIVERRRSLTQSKSFHFSLLCGMAYGFWNLRSLPYALQDRLSNRASTTQSLQRRLSTGGGCCGTVHPQAFKLCLPTTDAASLQE